MEGTGLTGGEVIKDQGEVIKDSRGARRTPLVTPHNPETVAMLHSLRRPHTNEAPSHFFGLILPPSVHK